MDLGFEERGALHSKCVPFAMKREGRGPGGRGGGHLPPLWAVDHKAGHKCRSLRNQNRIASWK